jgi:hypothetical protein
MAGIAFPDVSILVSSADPNDPNAVDWWTDLAIRTWRVNQAGRGRQYEQDQNMTGRFSCDWRNVDEYLNAANTTSPLLALAKPMRRLRWMGSYPPAGTGNLINTLAGQDPTVDSYTVGTLPSWLAPVGGTNPTVQAANPHSGANSVQYTVAATTTQQGTTTVPLSTRPGRQYTASWWVRQSTGSTQQIAVQGLTALDRFQRTTASGVGTAESGQVWTTSGGAAGDYSTTPGPNPPGIGSMGISNASVNVARRAVLPLGAQDFDFRILVTLPAVAAGASIVVGLEGRYADANNHYRIELDANTNGTLDLLVRKNVAGTLTTLATTSAALTYAAGTQVWIRAQGTGTTIQGKVWAVGATEPSGWTATATDAAITAAGSIAILNLLTTGNTNGTTAISHTRLAVTNYSAPGTTTTATATYTRLSVTFTATATTHAVQVATVGTAVAGTVNLDDVQLEPGATATTFTSSGPLIRGLWGGQLGELPATWVPGSAGYEGSVAAVANGPLGTLQNIQIHTDYITSVLAKAPDYYWPLWDGSGVTRFAEISGHGGPNLIRTDSKYGAAATFTPGSSIAVAGDPSGVGVLINSGATTSNSPLSIAQTGLFGTPPVAIASATTPWSITWAWWIKHDTQPASTGSPIFGRSTDVTFSAQGAFWQVVSGSPSTLFWGLTSVTDTWGGDGKFHLYVGVRTASGGNLIDTLYVDGVQVATTTTAGTFAFGTNTIIEFGADINLGFSRPGLINATYAHAAIWNRALTSAEITDLYNAGAGNLGETSGTRAGRYLGKYYVGGTVVDTTSMSHMGAPSATEGTTLLAALQRIQDTEAGNLFENRDGALQFDGREIRYLRTTPTVVFGDGPGEVPYSGNQPPIFGFDLQQVNNQAVITRTGGIRAVANTDTTGSINTNYARGYTLTVDCQTDNEAYDHANWVVANRSQPKQRAKTITVDVGSNPSLFPTVMNLEIGTRCTVNRRPKAANAGAGITMSADYFLENIQHRQVDPELGTWLVDLQLSPAPLQPWILNDATYSVLGSTTRLGF